MPVNILTPARKTRKKEKDFRKFGGKGTKFVPNPMPIKKRVQKTIRHTFFCGSYEEFSFENP